MSEPTIADLKHAVIQLDGKIDAMLETMAHMSGDIGDLQKAFAHLNQRIHAIEHRLDNQRE